MTEVHHRGQVAYVRLGDVIDEDNDLAELPARARASTCVVDFRDVGRINSCGVRDWVRCVTELERYGASLILVAVSVPVVRQLNTVHNFRGNAAIKSFFAPYFCRSCEREVKRLCELSEVGGPPFLPPVKRCDDCERALEFDDLPDSYFLFLNHIRPYVDNRAVRLVLDELASDDDDTRAIRRRVDSLAIAPSLPDIPRAGGSLSSLSSLPSLPTMPEEPSIPTMAARPMARRPAVDSDDGDTIIDAPPVFRDGHRVARRAPASPGPYIALVLAALAGVSFAAGLTSVLVRALLAL